MADNQEELSERIEANGIDSSKEPMDNLDSRLSAVTPGSRLVFRKEGGRVFHLIETHSGDWVSSYCSGEREFLPYGRIPDWKEIPQGAEENTPGICKACLKAIEEDPEELPALSGFPDIEIRF